MFNKSLVPVVLGFLALEVSAAQITGRLRVASDQPASGVAITFVPVDSICSASSGRADPIQIRTDQDGRYRAEVEASIVWRMEVEAPGGRLVSREVAPVLYPDRLPPLWRPSLATRRIRAIDLSGTGLADVRVMAPGRQLEHGYILEPYEATTHVGGWTHFPLAQEEHQDLRFQGFRIAELVAEGTYVTARLRKILPPTAERPEHRQLYSLLVTDESQSPLRDAMVWRLDRPGCYGRSDQDGYVKMAVPAAPDRLGLMVGALGYELVRLEVTSGERVIRVRLPRSHGILKSRIVDPEDRPIEDASVIWPEARRTTFSNEEGEFLMQGLRVNRWADIELSSPGFVPRSIRTLVLHEGEQFHGRWRLNRPTTLEGEVVDERGRAATAVEVVLGGSADVVTQVNGHGRFRLTGVPNGHQILLFQRDGAIVGMKGLTAPAEGGRLDLGTVRLEPSARIEGSVVDDGGYPVADASISANLDPLAVPGAMADMTDNDGRPAFPILARTDEAGYFFVEGLHLGSRISLAATQRGFAHRQTLISLDKAEQSVTLTLSRLEELRIRILSKTDGSPLVGAVVTLDPGLPEAMDDGIGRDVILLSDYSGEILVEVFPGGEGGYTVEREGYVKHARSVRFPDSPHDDLVIELEPEAVLSGRVRDANGRPVPEVYLRAMEQFDDAVPPSAITDEDGEFVLHGLRAGPATLILRSRDFGRQERQIDVLPGGQTEIELLLDEPRRFRLSGQIWIDGEIARGIRLTAMDSSTRMEHYTISDASGWFTFEDLAEGTYSLSMMGQPFIFVEGQKVALSSDVLDWRIVVRRRDSRFGRQQ